MVLSRAPSRSNLRVLLIEVARAGESRYVVRLHLGPPSTIHSRPPPACCVHFYLVGPLPGEGIRQESQGQRD